MSLDTTIRRARPSDTTAIKACVEAAYEHYIPQIGKPPGPVLDDYSQVVQQHQAFVVEVKGQVVGFLVLIVIWTGEFTSPLCRPSP